MQKIEIIKSKLIPVSSIEQNKGQIDGLPKNPRLIKDAKFEKLKKSIEDNPEMLGARELIVYPYNDKFVIIGGNMRFTACKELGYKELPCKVLPADYSVEQLRAITIKDNVAFGENDFEKLANEWDNEELEEWGIEIYDKDEEEKKENGEIIFSNELDFESNYIVLKFTKDIDFINIQSLLGLQSTYSKRQNGKPWSKGLGRVVDGVDAIIKIQEQ
jgi:hypothetical protein